MKTKFIYVLLLCTVILSSIISCGKEDSDNEFYNESNINNEDNASEVLQNGTEENPIIGNWYEVSISNDHKLYTFKDDGTYKYYSKINNTPYKEEGHYQYTKDSIFFTSSKGKTIGYKITILSRTKFQFFRSRGHSFNLKPSTLTSLEDDCVPSTKEQALNITYVYGETGGISIIITPHHGITHYYYAVSETIEENPKSKGTNILNKKYNSLKLGTQYYVSAIAYNAKGEKYSPTVIEFKTKGRKDMINYFVYKSEYYELFKAEMSQKHFYSGTGTGSNCKYLTLYNSDEDYIKFEYAVAEWEGIDKKWNPGTYKIVESSEYYKYMASLILNKKVQHDAFLEGTLKITEKANNYFTFDFSLYDISGHFEGKIQ